MLLLAHMGITLGTAQALDVVVGRWRSARARRGESAAGDVTVVVPRPASLMSRIDVRLLLLGSVLPDLIDKPLGQVVFRDTFSNGRIFCHTLLFLVVISLLGYYIWQRQGKTWLIVIAFGVFMHLLLDGMWHSPHTLLWPFYGWAFPRRSVDHFWRHIVENLEHNPGTYVPEIIGLVILGWFALGLVYRKRVHAFLRNGAT